MATRRTVGGALADLRELRNVEIRASAGEVLSALRGASAPKAAPKALKAPKAAPKAPKAPKAAPASNAGVSADPAICVAYRATITVRDTGDRLEIRFPAKPAHEVRAALRACAFTWSPEDSIWHTEASDTARFEAHRIACMATGASAPHSVDGASW